jgi:hypothetical protein
MRMVIGWPGRSRSGSSIPVIVAALHLERRTAPKGRTPDFPHQPQTNNRDGSREAESWEDLVREAKQLGYDLTNVSERGRLIRE